MRENEKFSRREFLFLGITAALWGGLAYAQRKPLGSLVKTVIAPLPETSSAYLSEISGYIKVEGHGEWARTLVNKDAFATAMALMAQNEDPQNGLRKLRRFLYAAPLTIKLMDEDAVDIDASSGKITLRGGRYEGLFQDGPTIMYYPNTLEGYRTAQLNRDLPKLLEYDKNLLHEAGHLWQEARDLWAHNAAALAMGTLQLAEKVTRLPLFEHDSYDYEIEADRLAEGVTSANLGNTWEMELPWPFGKFFEFPA